MDPLFLRKRKYGWLAWTLAGALEISACLPKVIEVHQYPANPGSGILQTRKQKSMHSYLALGDSYTIGESVSIRDRYPVQTVEMLNKRNIPFSNPEIIAVTGWTSADLLRAIRDKQTPDPPFDVVSLLIGVNNQYQGRSLDEYKKEFSALLMQSIALAGNRAGHVIVLSIPDYAMTPFGKASGNQAGISAAIASIWKLRSNFRFPISMSRPKAARQPMIRPWSRRMGCIMRPRNIPYGQNYWQPGWKQSFLKYHWECGRPYLFARSAIVFFSSIFRLASLTCIMTS
jgi:GDSL-like Lipase/Acylhydrolase family